MMPRTSSKFCALQASQLVRDWGAMVETNKSQLAHSMGRSRLLVRRLLWPIKSNPSKHKSKSIVS